MLSLGGNKVKDVNVDTQNTTWLHNTHTHCKGIEGKPRQTHGKHESDLLNYQIIYVFRMLNISDKPNSIKVEDSEGKREVELNVPHTQR